VKLRCSILLLIRNNLGLAWGTGCHRDTQVGMAVRVTVGLQVGTGTCWLGSIQVGVGYTGWHRATQLN